MKEGWWAPTREMFSFVPVLVGGAFMVVDRVAPASWGVVESYTSRVRSEDTRWLIWRLARLLVRVVPWLTDQERL